MLEESAVGVQSGETILCTVTVDMLHYITHLSRVMELGGTGSGL